jgi:hypothetical protein
MSAGEFGVVFATAHVFLGQLDEEKEYEGGPSNEPLHQFRLAGDV